MELTAENVSNIFTECLCSTKNSDLKYKSKSAHDRDILSGIKVKGVVVIGDFHPSRLEYNKTSIIDMIDQLPDNFKLEGGWFFHEACKDVKGNQWTWSHLIVDQLLCLGLAIRKIEFTSRRWGMFPRRSLYFKILKI